MDLGAIQDASIEGAVSLNASDFVTSGRVNKVFSNNLTVH